ncbi:MULTISPECIES: GNAT family N-acetyltransferase [Priestia]|uniref:GNAT family N-acetyltransferase n=1 Tax=Priestia aryabhattai TaxID=412384 RepID=A0ABD5L305_PRIAR|nr:GNAT family N-acetyltransferase [Priestia aryabhattai]WJN47540.1 GNAT family N-acetyltransferase [Priestia aryabhattai]
MVKVYLKEHNLSYSNILFKLSSDQRVNKYLNFKSTSIEETKEFIKYVIEAEEMGTEISRVIFNEEISAVGVITLIDIDNVSKSCHLGYWLGHKHWAKGYITLAIEKMLHIAFEEIELEKVFIGARTRNIRSLKAQEKLPYISVDVGGIYPEILQSLESKEKESCTLNVVSKEDYLQYKLIKDS